MRCVDVSWAVPQAHTHSMAVSSWWRIWSTWWKMHCRRAPCDAEAAHCLALCVLRDVNVAYGTVFGTLAPWWIPNVLHFSTCRAHEDWARCFSHARILPKFSWCVFSNFWNVWNTGSPFKYCDFEAFTLTTEQSSVGSTVRMTWLPEPSSLHNPAIASVGVHLFVQLTLTKEFKFSFCFHLTCFFFWLHAFVVVVSKTKQNLVNKQFDGVECLHFPPTMAIHFA